RFVISMSCRIYRVISSGDWLADRPTATFDRATPDERAPFRVVVSFLGHATPLNHPFSFVMPGLVPGIHVFSRLSKARRGWPGQARP
ncbi:MAG TPA: hypothetical protein VI251_10195, partial [Pseudolabrys sp.]